MNRHSLSFLLLAGLTLLAACSEDVTSQGNEAATPVEKMEADSVPNSIKLTLDGTVYEYPVEVCQIMPGFALVQGKDGESGIAIKADITQTVASFQYYYNEDGARLWDTWDNQRDVRKTIRDKTISASGKMKRIARREFKAPNWEYLQNIETIEAPFTITASCKI